MEKHKGFHFISPKCIIPLLLSSFLWIIVILSNPNFHVQLISSSSNHNDTSTVPYQSPRCNIDIVPFYIYDLPDQFNAARLRRCHYLHPRMEMCGFVANRGLGQPIPQRPSWYVTSEAMSELLFHARAETHPCRVYDPHIARIFYIPFYTGQYVSSVKEENNLTRRDATGIELAAYLSKFPSFYRQGGLDHFLIMGSRTWEGLRSENLTGTDFGTNKILRLPKFSNLTILTVDSDLYVKQPVQMGIPYPSYFHPSTSDEMVSWQETVRHMKRTHLFSYIGGVRPWSMSADIRSKLLKLCKSSDHCAVIECEKGTVCYEPNKIMDLMTQSHFCLQPSGDSPTRRAVFDSVLAGCIPVFFSKDTAYNQYPWYLPKHPDDWSVFIEPDHINQLEKVLKRIPEKKIKQMREVVIEMIPRVTYVHPNASRDEIRFWDVVDVALAELTKQVKLAA
ncbi:Xyloglucan galactosyltransferase KATAMARI1 [Rhynchospora pubera]|uniref:Xyloglucan galactosyltransferase KATAMARI1 n=2 Tax=Rhynchospora pubera TaxID=906938 RepID=A0AAV8CDP3_9POAL|nr:Xyloglucan galactosyltransferase KATAMARI1 [Rhynchospora pubera]